MRYLQRLDEFSTEFIPKSRSKNVGFSELLHPHPSLKFVLSFSINFHLKPNDPQMIQTIDSTKCLRETEREFFREEKKLWGRAIQP